jgi:hypothetical protein
MTYLDEWRALSARFQSSVTASGIHARHMAVNSGDPHSRARRHARPCKGEQRWKTFVAESSKADLAAPACCCDRTLEGHTGRAYIGFQAFPSIRRSRENDKKKQVPASRGTVPYCGRYVIRVRQWRRAAELEQWICRPVGRADNQRRYQRRFSPGGYLRGTDSGKL